MINDRPSWHADAACRGATTLFFPERGKNANEPRKICDTCPVAEPCLQQAIDTNETLGIWAGTSPRQRRKIGPNRNLELRPINNHGTHAGYIRHHRRNEEPCDDCRRAHNRYQQGRRSA